ncbi:hypothetical protein AURDEDRAFT_109713 [Auricularia subglabra TFB-10046 SS5]|nr:hypothetical protein AURDEDRAFT_109713 [Auricularia subglabra TFB-10046 SS5]
MAASRPALNGIAGLYNARLGVTPTSVDELPAGSGEFNRIYKVSHPALADHDNVETSFLRLSKPLIPYRKTENEVASMAFARERLPPTLVAKCPKVLAFSSAPEFDASPDSVHAFEWTILSRVPGAPLLEIFDPGNDSHIAAIIQAVVELEAALAQSCRTAHIGGLCLVDGAVKPGPVVTFDMWDAEKLQQFSDTVGQDGQRLSTAFKDWNPAGPFLSESAYIRARLERDLRVLRLHPACVSLRANRHSAGTTFEDALQAAVRTLDNPSSTEAQIDGASPGFALSHRDLHLGNFLAVEDATVGITVSGILDWELAQCMPLDKWEPSNTLISPQYTSQADAWRERLFADLDEALPGALVAKDSPSKAPREAWWSFTSLTFWIIYRAVDPGSETRQEEWRQRWWKLYFESMQIKPSWVP